MTKKQKSLLSLPTKAKKYQLNVPNNFGRKVPVCSSVVYIAAVYYDKVKAVAILLSTAFYLKDYFAIRICDWLILMMY